MSDSDPLRVRLFGYGVLYQVRFGATGKVAPLATEAGREAGALARELAVLRGGDAGGEAGDPDVWGLSMPFGRCGVEGLPHEHLMVFHQQEGYLDVLQKDGYHAIPLEEGRLVTVSPGMVIRVRARPRPGRRVVVAFQTEDHTPLAGNAGPFTLDGVVPEKYGERLAVCHAAFDQVRGLAAEDRAAYQAALDRFFAAMAARLEGNEEVRRIQQQARAQGSYQVDDQHALFARQQSLLTPETIARIAAQEEGLFRFPGMFGGVAPLFPLIA